MTDSLRRLILEQREPDDLRAVAREQGMRTLREDGFEKVRQGMTSVAEVLRVAGSLERLTLDPGRAPRGGVRRVLQLVAGQRLELDAERQLDQAVGQPHVLRAAAGRAGRCRSRCRAHALVAVLAVVAVPGEHASERLLARRRDTCARRGSRSRRSRAGRRPGRPRSRSCRSAAGPARGRCAGPPARRRAAPRRPARRSGRAAGSRRRRRAPRRRARPRRGARRAWSRPCRAATADLVAILAAAHVEEVVRVRVDRVARATPRRARSRCPRHSQRARSTAMLPRSA